MAKNFELKEEQQKKLAPLFAQLLQAFQTMKWVRNYNRKNASDGPCDSMSFGMVNRFEHGNHGSFGLYPSANNDKYPYLFQLLTALADIIGFPCTTFCVNRNFQCKMHRDRVNEGDSVIVALGNYTGGELIIEDDNGVEHMFNIKNKFLQFDGARYLHGTRPFQGERYSIIMYTPTSCKSKGEAARRCRVKISKKVRNRHH